MTTVTDLANQALIIAGQQKKISSLSQDSVEAQLIAAIYDQARDDLLRMAPWNCAVRTANLVYITSIPGTAQNQSPAQATWSPGLPQIPWSFEYQYPVDCLRPCYILPSALSSGFSGVPLTTAVTGLSVWTGAPIPYRVATDKFFMATSVTVNAGGTGYATNDEILLAYGPPTAEPVGGPARVRVSTVGGGGVVTAAALVNQLPDSESPASGSYFQRSSLSGAQGATTGNGTGASFSLGLATAKVDQRIILTNQEYASLVYVAQVTDPNVMDSLFRTSLISVLAAGIALSLTKDKNLANMCISRANAAIAEARKADGNEGLTVNNVTPDWIRVRGIAYSDTQLGPYAGVDWGNSWPVYA